MRTANFKLTQLTMDRDCRIFIYMYMNFVHFIRERLMRKINATEFRNHLSGYLREVQKGTPLQITSHGRVVARLVPEGDEGEEARKSLLGMRASAQIGDVISPIGEAWEAERDRV